MSMNKADIKNAREQKLSAKLKENLRRRKVQTRARATVNDEPTVADNPEGGHENNSDSQD